MAPAKRNAVPSDAPRRRSERTSTKRSSAAGELSHDAPHIDVVDDEDEEATSSAMADQWLFDIKAKLDSPTFDHPDLIQKLDPKYFNLEFVKQTGLVKPLFFDAPPTELGMKMPNAQRFGVNEVKKLVTPEREIEVVVVKTQTSRKMTMNEFANYYKKKAAQRKNLLNVLSLEFSMTPLEQKVRAPELIKSIDWVELYWPKALRKRQEYLTNPPADVSTYPKVQNYCLMSVSDCYTDFHIDFGGTSVWYHVLKGEKIFFMIEPTEQNIKVYEGWTLSGSDQNKTFFGDIVVKCARVRLVAGNTFVIPSGWIHAVYTPADSLVFGGNFLHSYAIPMQLRVYQSESITHVRKRYRYPYFIPMLWYVAERLVRRATGRCYLADIKSTPLLEAEPTIRSSDSRTSSADSQLVDPDYVATDGSLMDTSTDSFVVVDDVAADEKATDAALKLPSHTASLPESSQASLTTSGTAPSCSSPPRLERADTEERKAVGAEEGNPGSRQTAPGDRLPFALNSPAFSSTNESEGEDNRKLPPPPIEPFSPTQNIPVSEREPFTPANKFDDNYLTSLTQFERDGINALMQFLMKLTEKNREVGEGILEPDHILKDLQCTFTRVCELKDNPSTSSTPADQVQEPIDQENNEKPPIVDVPSKKATPPPSSKKSPAAAPKRARLSGPSGAPSASSAPSAAAKKPKKKKQSDAKEKSTTPPPPSPVVPAKYHGFDPMSELVALGHKPLPTAFRMGPNMATAPSVQRSILHRPKPLDTTGSGEVSSADHGPQISPSSDGRDPSTPTSQSSAFSALPIVHRQKQPQQQQLHDPSWPPTSAPIRPGDPRRQAALHQQQILRAALTAESPMMAGNYAARGIHPHATTSFDHTRPQFRPPNYYHSPSAITSASHMQHHNPHQQQQQHQQQLAHHGYRPGFLPQPVPPPSLHSVPSPMNAVLFGSMPYQPVAISVDGAGSSSAYHLEGGQQRSPQLPSPQSRPPQHHGLPPYTPLSQRSQGAPQVSPLLAGTPSPTATTSQPAHFGGGFFAPPSVMTASVSASKRQSLSSAEQFPMGPPKLLIPHLATTQPSAGVEATDRPRKSQLMSPKEEGKLEGQATINALDELTRALKNEPSPPSKQAEAKEDAPEEPTAGVDPLSWADELASLTQVMTEN